MPLHPMPLAMAAGATLGADVYAKIDIPAFEQSSMDGYAIRFDERLLPLNIGGEMQAGADQQITLLPEHAARIFTGAPLPHGADTVVMQEKVEVSNGVLHILDDQLSPGLNVRPKGAEAAAGALAMQKGCKLSPAAIGFLAGIGLTEVEICLTPSVAIIVTGKELQRPGEELAFGQVYESNSYSLTAALELAQVTKINFYSADDELDELTAVLKEALALNDVVLLTGGVSVGDYDFVLRAAEASGVQQIFHKVKQKPGKPLYFGKTDKHIVFGLPGNPSSVLSCFYQYVLPALEKMMGYKSNIPEKGQPSGSLKTQEAVLTHECTKGAGLTHFLKAHFNDGNVTPLSAQESFRMSSFAQANAMIELPEEETVFAAGTKVKVYIFPE
ncbi:molybdopterin molybdotransferase [Pedobacter westerhofensis]|uniref:Molybdopterin molybdenumtransferase n=2 Tax=Pedobacter westerhofensis TaxID=425512 RepID=A0A521CCJ8_9SPHI|nr:molybdopterin molybdotransferase [Pedobacter westerhofensis]